MQFEIIKNHPYQYTSDEVLFRVYALKNNITEEKWESEKAKFFAKGQPCFRSSPLTKRYGWGVHFNIEGKIAIYVMESDDYKKFSTDKNLKILRALRSKRI